MASTTPQVTSVAARTPGVVSRHLTSGGTVVWTRCSCGRLRMAYSPAVPGSPADPPLVAGGRTPGCPDCP